MGFLSSLFLWALPLTAVPVIIHLMNRRRREVVRWGAMRLLLESAPRKERIWQISDLLLLIARTLAIAAIILAFARPQIRSSLFSGAEPGRDVILVVDASLSTGRMHGGAPVFDQIRQKAAEIAESLDDSDRVRLMLAASTPHWVNSGDGPGAVLTKSFVAEQITGLKPTLAAADMPTCLQSALLSEASPEATSRLIVAVTDGTAHGWAVDSGSRWQTIHEIASRAAIPTALNIVTVDVPSGPVVNLSVEKLTASRTRVASGEPFSVTAQIRNTGDAPRDATKLKWEIDGDPAGESSVLRLEPGQSIDVAFETTCDKTGAHAVACSTAGKDDLPGDDAASVVVESLERLPILICRAHVDEVQPASQPDFLKAALGRGPETPQGNSTPSVFEPTVIGLDALASSDLTQYRCVVLDNVLPGSAEVVDALADYIHDGGGVWFVLGENITAEAFNTNLYREGAGLSPVSIERRVAVESAEPDDLVTIHPPEGTHPATVLLGDTERLDIDDVRIKEHWKLQVPETAHEAGVLLEAGDGDPLAVENFLGNGRVIVLALPCDTKWSNLPVCQAFVPLVQEWVWYLTQPTAANYNLDPGTPIVIASAKTDELAHAEIATPLGNTVELSDGKTGGERVLRYRETAFPGNYDVTLTAKAKDIAEQQVPFYVRRDAGESRLATLSDEQKQLLSQAGGVRFGIDPLSLPENTSEAIHYQPLWSYFIAAVVLLFIAEFIFTRVLAKNRYADVVQTEGVVLAAPHGYAGLRREREAVSSVN